jgi:aminoglycoside phosphotransferase family enzyme/predicted kinase
VTFAKEDLLGPGIELVETHAAWVFLGSSKVWKVKKPVNLGFLDYSTVEKRRLACEAEVRLNERLAPRVYDGVVPVGRDASGRLSIGAAGEPVDWAVQMVRLADAHRADVLLADGRLSLGYVESIAEHVARFHARMPTTPEIAEYGRPDVILANVMENFAQTQDTIDAHLSRREAAEIEVKQLDFIDTHRALFEARIRSGRIRDGHGDLRLEHVYLPPDGPPVIIDCIEFNERFRYADVCADVAFLSMDLERLGRADLAEHFLAVYARESGDYELYRLVDFYEAYRAYVRGKVASMLAMDSGASFQTRERARKDARRAYLLSLLEGREALIQPAVVAVGGFIASGKSTIAELMGPLLSAPVVAADVTRKAMLDVEKTTPLRDAAWTGAYSPEQTEQVYAEVLRRADHVLASGRPVILDASFRSRKHRDAARALAQKHGVPFYFLECTAPDSVCRERLHARAKGPSVSDGRKEIYDAFIASWEPVTELPPAEHVVVDTTRPARENVGELREVMATWPVGLTQ